MEFQKNQIHSPERTAFIASIAAGVTVHGYALFNVISNYDNIRRLHSGFGAGIRSGRWFLELMNVGFERLNMDHNLPAFNGLLLIFMLALSAAFAVSAFQVKKPWAAAIMGALFAVFPTVTSTMLFRYTAFPDGLGILFSVLAVWVLPKKGGLILSGMFTALSLGVYQAYVPVTITMFVIQLILMSMKEDSDFWAVVRRGLYCCASLVLGLAAYYLLVKLFLNVFQQELLDYQGINNMGKIPLSALPGLIIQAYVLFLTMPFRNYCGLANNALLSGGYIVLALISVVLVLLPLLRRKKFSTFILTGGLCFLLPLAANFIIVICPDSFIYTLMVYAFVLVPCFPLILLGHFDYDFIRGKELLRRLTVTVTVLMAILYGYFANVTYTAQYYATEQVQSYVSSILTQARMTPGFDAEKKWAFIGNNQDPMYSFLWEDDLVYGGTASSMELIHGYSFKNWFDSTLGFTYPTATAEDTAMIMATEEFAAMPCWPDYGSMQVIGDCLVIKYQPTIQ